VVGRFLEEMLYGILCRQSVRVSEIGRALNEQIRLIKTENRLCRQLGRCGLEERVTENLIEEGAAHIRRDTLLLIDPSDISKKYAKKMEYLAHVRDGSEKKLSRGYWTVRVVGADNETGRVRRERSQHRGRIPSSQTAWEEGAAGYGCGQGPGARTVDDPDQS